MKWWKLLRDDIRADGFLLTLQLRSFWATSRLAAVGHILRGHAVQWKTAADVDAGCPGDIICHTCGVCMLCRWSDPWEVWKRKRSEQ